MKKRFDKSEKLTLRKIKQDFCLINSYYFSEINYDGNGRFFDLYFQTDSNRISHDQIATYNNLIDNLDKYLSKIDQFIKNNYTKDELDKLDELNQKKLSIDVIEILINNEDFDSVLVCGKQYKLFGIFNRDIGIRVEIKNEIVKKIERKTDTTKTNGN